MRILLVDDDEVLSAALIRVLEANRYAIDRVAGGQAGLDLAAMMEYDLILLDVERPQLDGISLCQRFRSQGYQKPILLLTANDANAVAIAGFEAGADDCINKRCPSEVLLARIRTLLRRSGALLSQMVHWNAGAVLRWQTLRLDLDSGRVTIDGQELPLTPTEYNLLELLLRHPDRIFSRAAILDQLWGLGNAPSDRAIVTHIKDLRKKLKAGGLTEDIIATVYGMGYRLKPAPPSPPDQQSQSQLSPPQPANRKTAAIDKVLQRFRGTFDQQVAVLEQVRMAFVAGQWDIALQHSARQEAHKLAGSLASFGYPEGSTLARSLEHLLMDVMGDRPFSAETITQFSDQVAALQQVLGQPPLPATHRPTPTPQTCRVLVIDDDLALTQQLKAESEARGLRIKIATHLSEARSRLSVNLPDVVVLDLSFSETEGDGLTLLQEMNERFPDLPVIVFTGRNSLADRLAVARLGARHFLHKPASIEQIFQAIARVQPALHTAEARVLMVDDDPAMLTLLSGMLSPWGLTVVTLSEPQHFWQMLVETKPDVVVVDLEMPCVNGLELCQVVRQDVEWETLPILVVTARSDTESLQQAFAAGADDFITKPVLGPELVTRVLNRIERTRWVVRQDSPG